MCPANEFAEGASVQHSFAERGQLVNQDDYRHSLQYDCGRSVTTWVPSALVCLSFR